MARLNDDTFSKGLETTRLLLGHPKFTAELASAIRKDGGADKALDVLLAAFGTKASDYGQQAASRGDGMDLARIRTAQAKRYWDLGVGIALGFKKFKDYLYARNPDESLVIPEIQQALLEVLQKYGLKIVLVETRLDLKKFCELSNIAFDVGDETFVDYDARHAEFKQPAWIAVDDGRKNRNRSVSDCRKTFTFFERGLTALQGVCAYLQHPTVVTDLNLPYGHVMDLAGSVHRENRGNAAYLFVSDGRARLGWRWSDYTRPRYGSASGRECEP